MGSGRPKAELVLSQDEHAQLTTMARALDSGGLGGARSRGVGRGRGGTQ